MPRRGNYSSILVPAPRTLMNAFAACRAGCRGYDFRIVIMPQRFRFVRFILIIAFRAFMQNISLFRAGRLYRAVVIGMSFARAAIFLVFVAAPRTGVYRIAPVAAGGVFFFRNHVLMTECLRPVARIAVAAGTGIYRIPSACTGRRGYGRNIRMHVLFVKRYCIRRRGVPRVMIIITPITIDHMLAVANSTHHIYGLYCSNRYST